MTEVGKKKGFFECGGAWVLIQFVLMAAVIVAAIMFHEAKTWPVVRVTGIALLLVSGVFGIPA